MGKIVDGGLATMQRELPNMIAAFRASRPQAIRPDGLEGQLASEGGQTACHNRATDGARVVFRGDQNDSVCWGNLQRRLLRTSGQRSTMEVNGMTGPCGQRLFVALLAASSALPLYAYDPLNRVEYLAKIKEAKAYYEEKCEKVAGIRIHKTVPDVEGLLLLKVRPERRSRELADPMWPGAAFGREATGDSYITSFLGYEYRASKNGEMSPWRGYIGTTRNPGGLPGYRWVEVIDEKDGQRYRYSGSVKAAGKKNPDAYRAELENDPAYDMNTYRWSLDKIPSPSKTPPRYAVTFEDHVIPDERALWVASSTVKVLDLKTHEVLGEMTRYAISYIHAPHHSMPWISSYTCGTTSGGASTETRQFVDQVLIPKKED
ncbi:MAG: hypothetical protein JNK06_15650 [Candidatus Accumulibacter phosphatis]|uniref:hypothetical protein n=1 Tax=Candidatus Accumulibacter phosphatis TaxID=327160 RepID=UPI001A4A8978|nr:hypothetical protein [Candidatus Accumulibacter phosphatis]